MKKTKLIIAFLVVIIFILGGFLIQNYFNNSQNKQQEKIEESYQKGLKEGLIDSFDNIFTNVKQVTTLTVEDKGLIILIPELKEE